MWQPRNDLAFKALFGEPSRSHLLARLLNAVLQDRAPNNSSVPPLAGLDIENPGVPPDHLTGKSVILDVVARAVDGRRFNIEVQLWRQPGHRSRMLFYWAKRFGSQLVAGQGYTSLKPAILVVFQGFESHDLPDFHSVIELRARGTWRRWSPDLELHVLQLSRLPAFSAGSTMELTQAQAWGLFLALDDEDDRERLTMTHSYLEEAQEAWKRLSADERLREEARVREGTLAALAAARGEGLEEGREGGRLEASRRMLTLVLQASGLVVSDDVRAVIEGCQDVHKLEAWAQSAATASSIDDVFGT